MPRVTVRSLCAARMDVPSVTLSFPSISQLLCSNSIQLSYYILPAYKTLLDA